MPEPLSMAAGCFAVVGVTHLVIHSGKKVCQFLGALKQAPLDVESLRSSIFVIVLLAEDVKVYLEETGKLASAEASPSNISLMRTLPQFKSALDALSRELRTLVSLAERYKGVSRSWESFKFVLDERKLKKSTQKIEIAKSTLIVAFLVTGRAETLLSQEKIGYQLRQDFEDRKTLAESNARNLERNEEEAQAKFEDLKSAVRTSDTNSNQQVQLLRADISNGSQKLLQRQREDRDQASWELIQGITVISAKLDKLSTSIAHGRLPPQQNGRQYRFWGPNRRDVLLPLLLLQSGLRNDILSIIPLKHEPVSTQGLHWLQNEFETLVASATQEAALLAPNSPATSLGDWYYPSDPSSSRQESVMLVDRINQSIRLSQRDPLNKNTAPPAGRVRKSMHSFEFTLPSGRLYILIPRPATTGGGAFSKPRSTQGVNFQFVPKPEICSTSISGNFTGVCDFELPQSLFIRLNAFTIVENEVEHLVTYVNFMMLGTLEQIESAIRLCELNPYAHTEDGHNILMMAATCSIRSDVVQHLGTMGLGVVSLQDALSFLVTIGRRYLMRARKLFLNESRQQPGLHANSENVELLASELNSLLGFGLS